MTDASPTGYGVADLQARVARVAFSSWLEIRVLSVEGDHVVLTMDVRPEMRGSPETGALHGGVLASLIDIACSYAIIAPSGKSVSTVDMRVDFHAPALNGPLRVEGRAVRRGKTISVGEARITEPDGRLVASGRAVLHQRSVS